MGLLGVVRPPGGRRDQPLHECPELTINPEFVEMVAHWSWKPGARGPHDHPVCLMREEWMCTGDLVEYRHPVTGTHAVWRVLGWHPEWPGLMIRWPD